MKIIHIPAVSDIDVSLSAAALKKLPKIKFGIVTTIQHLKNIEPLKKQIKSIIAGQVLGCNVSNAEKIKKKVDAFLFVGTGVFHPLYVAFKTKLPVWVWNPAGKSLSKIKDEDIKKFEKKRNAFFSKFLMSNNIGILVSLKLGQNNFAKAKEFSERKDKNYYLFVTDSINYGELENFPFIDCWVNAACPRIVDDNKNMINLYELANLLKFKSNKSKPIWECALK